MAGFIRASTLQLTLFVGDLFAIPVADSSFDVVYTSHSIEPNQAEKGSAHGSLHGWRGVMSCSSNRLPP